MDEFITLIVNESDDAYSSRQNTVGSHMYLCQLKTCILLGKAVQGLSAAGSTSGCVTDQQYDFGQDLILSLLYSLPFYLFQHFGYFWTPGLSASFSDAVSATLVLVKSYMPQISGICFYS